jgi:hypothetical protein
LRTLGRSIMPPPSKPKTSERRLNSSRSAGDFHNFAADDMEGAARGRGFAADDL